MTTGPADGGFRPCRVLGVMMTLHRRLVPRTQQFELLAASIDTGAVVVTLGAYTNLARLEAARPGNLGRTRIVVTGGWISPPRSGLLPWGPEMGWNVQCDTTAV